MINMICIFVHACFLHKIMHYTWNTRLKWKKNRLRYCYVNIMFTIFCGMAWIKCFKNLVVKISICYIRNKICINYHCNYVPPCKFHSYSNFHFQYSVGLCTQFSSFDTIVGEEFDFDDETCLWNLPVSEIWKVYKL